MIQIIGAGAIGCLWLARLQQSGQACHLVSRAIKPASTLHFTNQQGQRVALTISHGNQLLNKRLIEKQSTILVCVKAQHVVSALLAQRTRIKPQQPIILMHNGYGCAEQVIALFPDNPIISATTANASLKNALLDITITGLGPSYFGAYNALATDLSAIISPFQKAMDHVYWSSDINHKCWLKLIINAAINPLTAIHQIQNGQLQQAAYQLTIESIIDEVFNIANAENILFQLKTLQETVSNVIQATAENFSSMNRDIYYQRQTEIDFINGYLINKAQQHHIATPILTDLYQKIKVMENRSPVVVNN